MTQFSVSSRCVIAGAALVVLVLAAVGHFDIALAKGKGGGGGKGGNGGDARSGRSMEEMISRGVVKSGLTLSFPAGLHCTEIASAFASPTRYDGSKRPANRNAGLHGGTDLSLDIGTPLLAIADGTVISKGEGGVAIGIYVWLYHPPSATGFSRHLFVKYQHLKEPSSLAIGTAVTAGQIVALSGDTGTDDRHFGPAGYPHLHASVFASRAADYDVVGTQVRPTDGSRGMDLMALYLKPEAFDKIIADPTALSGTTVAVPALATNAPPVPGGKVWPVYCTKE